MTARSPLFPLARHALLALALFPLFGCADGANDDTADTGETDTADTSGNDTADTGGDTADTSGNDTADTSDTDDEPPVDVDGDGSPAGVDCDDENPAVKPGATEVCNGRDDDCNPATADAGVWHVAGETWTDRTAEFSAGTSGSPASVSLAGGALHVCDGTYDVSVAVTASAVVLGHGTTEAPVLRGSQTASVLSVTTGGVDLDVRSLTLVPGGTDRATSTRNGGGVRCEPSTGESSVSLYDVTVRDGKLSSGGGVYASHCDVAITESAFRGLEVTFGGAVYATGAASAFSVSIADSVIEDNTAQQYGAGVYAYGFHASTVSLEDTIVEGNAAWRGGGLWLGGTVTATCTASAAGSGAIRDNSAGHYGGGVVAQDAAFSSALCDFGESTTDNAPTDVHVTGASPLTYADYGPNATFSCTSTGCASI